MGSFPPTQIHIQHSKLFKMTYFPEPAWSNIVSYQLDYKKAHTQIWPYIKIDTSPGAVKYKVGVHDCPSIRDVVPVSQSAHLIHLHTRMEILLL